MKILAMALVLVALYSCQSTPEKKAPVIDELDGAEQLTFTGANYEPREIAGQVYFVSERDGSSDIYRIEDSKTTRITYQNAKIHGTQVLDGKLFYASTFQTATEYPAPLFKTVKPSPLTSPLRRWELVTSDLNGSHPLTQKLKSIWSTQLRVSPDAQTVAYTSISSEFHQILKQDLKKDQVIRLQSVGEHRVFPAWNTNNELFWIRRKDGVSAIQKEAEPVETIYTTAGELQDLNIHPTRGFIFTYKKTNSETMQIFAYKDSCLALLTNKRKDAVQPYLAQDGLTLYFVSNQQIYRKTLEEDDFSCVTNDAAKGST